MCGNPVTKIEIPDRKARRVNAKLRAEERAAVSCPVVKACHKALDDTESIVDLKHALDLIYIELSYLPEARPASKLISRLLSTVYESP